MTCHMQNSVLGRLNISFKKHNLNILEDYIYEDLFIRIFTFKQFTQKHIRKSGRPNIYLTGIPERENRAN